MFDCDERLTRLASVIDEFVAEEFDLSNAAPQSMLLLGLFEQIDRLQADSVRRAGVWDSDGDWALEGALTPASWLRARGGLDEGEARELVRTARLARDHAPTGEALRGGAIRTRRAHQIAHAVKDRRDAYDANPDLLLRPAATMREQDFRTVVKNWKEAADDALAHKDANDHHEHRHLYASVTLAGMVRTDGLLDPEGGEILLAALDAAAEPDSPGDPAGARTPAQRRADALVAIAMAYLGGAATEGSRAPVHLDAVITIRSSDHDAPADLASLRYELDRVGPVPRWTVERLACDCSVGRVLMKGQSEVLDLGRKARVVSKAQRRALVHRDRHCAFPGCRRPPRKCDAHHIVTWLEGGATDLDNLVLLCRRHHVLVHEGGWRLTRRPDGAIDATPPEPGPPRPRGPDLTIAA